MKGIGQNFDDFLIEEGLYTEVSITFLKPARW